MLKAKKKIGDIGESIASHFLISNGYRILESHFCIQGGEIDLIVFDKSCNELVFVEVKTRQNDFFGTSMESVTTYKLRKLIYSAHRYLSINRLTDLDFRIDLVGIDFDNGKFKIEHLKDLQL